MVRTDEAYIRSLERRIRNQRAQLRWWNEMYERRTIQRKTSYRWSAYRVCELLRRLGSPHRVDEGGGVFRHVKVRKAGVIRH